MRSFETIGKYTLWFPIKTIVAMLPFKVWLKSVRQMAPRICLKCSCFPFAVFPRNPIRCFPSIIQRLWRTQARRVQSQYLPVHSPRSKDALRKFWVLTVLLSSRESRSANWYNYNGRYTGVATHGRLVWSGDELQETYIQMLYKFTRIQDIMSGVTKRVSRTETVMHSKRTFSSWRRNGTRLHVFYCSPCDSGGSRLFQ